MDRVTKLAFLTSMLLVASSACDVDVEVGESETSDETVGASMSDGAGPGETADPGDPGDGDTPGTADSGDDPGDTPDTGLPDAGDGDDTPGGGNCDPLVQDCLEGEGCYLVGDDYACAPTGEGIEGEACEASNDCQVGLQCNDAGLCAQYCDLMFPGSCGDAECVSFGGSVEVGLCELPSGGGCVEGAEFEFEGECHPVCDPLVQDCADGESCVIVQFENFICVPHGELDEGETCGGFDECLPGLMCAGDGDPLCSEFCDLDAPACPEGVSCSELFAEGTAPPGYENVGVCY
ncbi:MAG: hypothetical protein ACRBN8_01250 [Nannocystales bacterium]